MKATILTATTLAVLLGFSGCTRNPEVVQQEFLAVVKAGDIPNAENLATAQKLIQQGADVNRPEKPGGWYPIHYAAASGSAKMVKLLLASGANPNVTGVSANQAGDQQQISVTPLVVAQIHFAEFKRVRNNFLASTIWNTDTNFLSKPYFDIVDILQPLTKEKTSP